MISKISWVAKSNLTLFAKRLKVWERNLVQALFKWLKQSVNWTALKSQSSRWLKRWKLPSVSVKTVHFLFNLENRAQTFRSIFIGKNFSKNIPIQKLSLPFEIQGRVQPMKTTSYLTNQNKGFMNSWKDEVWYKSFRKYLEVLTSSGIFGSPDLKYYEQDPQYAKESFHHSMYIIYYHIGVLNET